MASKEKNRDSKKKNKGAKGILAAMIVALIGLLGFNMGLGDPGEGGTSEESGAYEENVDGDSDDSSIDDSETINRGSMGDDEAEDVSDQEDTLVKEGILTLYLKDDVVYTDDKLESVIEFEQLDMILKEMPTSGQVILIDKGMTTENEKSIKDLVDQYELSRRDE